MLAKLLIIIGLASAGLLLVLMNITTPVTAGAVGILAVFLLGYVIMTVVITFTVYLIEKLLRKTVGELSRNRTSTPFTLKKAYYYSSVVALAPVIFVSLQSVGGIGIYEVILVFLLVALGCLYIAKRTS